MAFLCGPQQGHDFDDDEQPTQPIRAQPELRYVAPPERPSFDPTDFAETWPELVAVEDLVRGALQRNRARPCPMCLYVRAVRDGEMVEIGPQLPRLCDTHRHALYAGSQADQVTKHHVYKHVYDWYHAPPDGQYSD